MNITQEEIYNLVTKSTGIDFLQSTGLALDPKWTGGMTTHMIVYNDSVYQVPTYEEGLKIVFDIKPKYGHQLDCDDHAYRDKVNVVDFCLDELGFTKPPTYGIMYVSPSYGRGVSHCTNVMIHLDHNDNLILRVNEPQSTRYTYQIDKFLCNKDSPLCTIPHLMIW